VVAVDRGWVIDRETPETVNAFIVNIATSADGYVARTDGNLDWLTRRPAPKGFYGLPKFSRSIDAKILGRKTFDLSVKMGATFSADNVHYMFSRRPPPASVPAGVQFVTESIRAFAERHRCDERNSARLLSKPPAARHRRPPGPVYSHVPSP
jgi:dihydrofolate reductase